MKYPENTQFTTAAILQAARKWMELSLTFDIDGARRKLRAEHPAVFDANSPQNRLFVEISKRFGEQAAHENADEFLPLISAALKCKENE